MNWLPEWRCTIACSSRRGWLPFQHWGEELAKKYLGGGFGGYALYLFASREDRDEAVRLHDGMRAVEPYCKSPF